MPHPNLKYPAIAAAVTLVALATPERALQITLQPDYDAAEPLSVEILNAVAGDREFRSDDAAMREAKVKVYSITVGFAGAGQ